MTPSAFAFVIVVLFASALFAADRIEVPLWKGGAPGTEGKTMKESVADKPVPGLVSGTWQPVLYAYLPPKELNSGTAIMICPGGGYNLLAMDHEGVQVAEFLNSFGIAGIICKYRVRENKDDTTVRERALGDAQRGMRVIRTHASEWNINPDRLGVLGFSAGGHLVVNLATHNDAGKQDASDAIEKQSCRPDFVVAIYAAYKLLDDVNENTPPMFLAHAADDTAVPVTNSTQLFEALLKHNVSAELHIFPTGGHGWGLGYRDTPNEQLRPLLKDWLVRRAYLHPTTKPSA